MFLNAKEYFCSKLLFSNRRKRCLKLLLSITGIWILFSCFVRPLVQMHFPEYNTFNNAFINLRKMARIGHRHNLENICTPKVNVTFFKTHKTASCSIQNIFLRFTHKNNYLMPIPRQDNYFGHPQLFHHGLVDKLKPGFAYNILCHHHRWNYGEITKVMPPNTVYVTILRDPVHVFESLYFYSNLSHFYNMSIGTYALANDSFYKHHTQRKRGLGRNQMSFDLGFKDIHFKNSSTVNEFLQVINEQFNLVMIAERMDESLVLLKNVLCWTFDDVVVFHHNVRFPETKIKLNKSEEAGLRRWNNVDQQLYDYFLEIFEKKIAEFGSDEINEEINQLKTRTDQWYEYCVEGTAPALKVPQKFRPYHPKTYGFILRPNATNTTCESLIMGELPFTKILDKKQQTYYLPKKIITKAPAKENNKAQLKFYL